MRRQLAQHGHRRGLVVDEDATFASGGDLAAQDDGVLVGIDAIRFERFGDALLGCAFDLEDRRDHGFVGARADDVARGFVAEQQGQGVDENGFAGAGFAGQQVQARGELDRQVIDHRVVF